MIKLLFDFIQLLNIAAPLLTSVAILALLAALLSKSIKKHATAYYTVFAIPFGMVAIPFVGRLFGVEMFSFNRIPFLGGILRDYIHMGTLGFPLLVIIMYVGALSPKNPYVKRLLGIRKELSILSGFPVLTHSLIRVTHNFPNALKFFTDNEGYMASGRVASALGAGVSSFSLTLGVLMLALFVPLWLTSFDSVRRRMGSVRWKKLQRWSYVLYAMLFIHAICIQVGSALNPRGGRGTPQPAAELIAATTAAPDGRSERSGARGDAVQPAADNGNRAETARPAEGGRPQSQGFADINVSSQAKRSIHIASLLLIFGSYLYLRLRKAKQNAANKLAK
ncbi:MAG: ferric reductase-like transmembrane domain-containing protein [Prevotellaceae bacterium]|jgi:DMSO/TMAO reductase YedYZ heme-binding membrane subunit|nr:ferric reductase-like transmembrane domain-containing protein [Prevotellaceae bacterium]